MNPERRLDFLCPIQSDDDIDKMSSEELYAYAKKHSIAVVVYDVVKLNLEDDDETIARYVSVSAVNGIIHVNFDEDDDFSSEFEVLQRQGPAQASIAKLWTESFIPTLCQRFSSKELNNCFYLSFSMAM